MKRNLDYWKDWVGRNESAYQKELERMDRREQYYRGEIREIKPLTERDTKRNGERRKTAHLWNIITELIESEVNSVIPQPKVTARRREDEPKAKILEDMLRNELDRLPMEELNDQAERMVPKQGGAFWLVEWDNSSRTHSAAGDVTVTLVHPKQVIPQDGVFTRVEDMDAIALKLAKTRAQIRREYGKNVEDETESDPDARTLDDDAASADGLVTLYTVYYRNDDNSIGKISWVGETLLEDIEDFQARIVRRCENCGAVLRPNDDFCPRCGEKKARETKEETEEIWTEKGISTELGNQIPGRTLTRDEMDLPKVQPTELPFYKPDVFPLFLQRNVSLFGKLLGDSDVDKIEDQQNTISRIETKMIDRLVKAGTRITLPDRADFRVDPEDGEKWYIGNAADKAMIGVYNFTGDLQWEMQYIAQVYEEAKRILGITDSYMGRPDQTAQSGVAKQFAAQQSAGRLESKRVLKEAAYAELFRRIVQLKVAYADEPRPIVAEDNRGQAKYEQFDRYDFYERDETGAWHCILDDDRFLFSCDVSAPLAANRPQMWQDLFQMLSTGAFGPPDDPQTLLMYWTEMELQHYPYAADAREFVEERIRQAQEQQAAAAEAQRQEAEAERLRQEAAARDQRDREDQAALQQRMADADQQARQDAWRTAQAMMGRQAGPVPRR